MSKIEKNFSVFFFNIVLKYTLFSGSNPFISLEGTPSWDVKYGSSRLNIPHHMPPNCLIHPKLTLHSFCIVAKQNPPSYISQFMCPISRLVMFHILAYIQQLLC